ncbi:hypothetical protein [Chondromyces apiculatus]|uniref:Lipoprotein n=1 Tax=Chondromyces apiculatus DSM 436 TaxID=1192034 RepID=A0A017SVC1_9BACT|nr:hypothetical protein [Chondromyces apiculatus]EYF00919.1 Hypothetical protein CAP_8867 [Chondromyces apiculatus DSM 436]
MMSKWILLGAGGVLAAFASGCLVSLDGDSDAVVVPGDPVGEMDFNWTIDNAADAYDCSFYALPGSALDLEMVLFDDRGDLVTREYAACEDFSLSLVISAERYYHAEVTMVDAADRSLAISTTQTLSDIWVEPETTVDLSVDFPPSSMQ